MKNVIILTCWALFAQILPLAAQQSNKQTPEVLQDTLVIQLHGSSQIHLTGTSLNELVKYERADSLKQLFLQDLQSGFTNGSFTEMPQRLHYLVSADGKRRLKAEFTDPAEDKFDLEHEKNRLRLDLPLNHFTVYDLKTNVQTHLYLQDSSAILLLEQASIKTAQQEASQDKYLKNYVRFTVEKQGDLYMGKGVAGNKIDMLSVEPLFGVGLIGNQLTPLLGAAIKLTLHNKYAIPKYEFGFQYNAFILSSEPGYNFREINPGSMYDITFGINTASKQGNQQWFGLLAGLTGKTRDNILPKHSFKSGVFFKKGAFIYSLESIKLTDKFYEKDDSKFLYMLTIKTSF